MASAGAASAALSPDATEVVLGTFGAALGVIFFLSVVYALKRALGLEKDLPPPEDSGASGHH